MIFLKKIVLVFLFLSLAACASKKAPPLPVTVHYFPSRPAPKITEPAGAADQAERAFKNVLDSYRSGRNEEALLAAYRLWLQFPETPWYKRSLFLTEQVLIQADLPAEADAAMLRVKNEYPEMADYAVFLLADYHFAKARFSQAAAFFESVTENYPKSSLATRAAYRRSQALLLSNAYGAAADALQAFLRDNPRSEFAPDAGLALARALLSESRPGEAAEAYRNVWIRFPGTAVDQEAARALVELSASGVNIAGWSGDEWYERGKNLFRTNQYDKAAEAFGKLLEKDPNSKNRTDALFRLGVSQFNTGRRLEAVSVLEKMVRGYPGDSRVPEALYWIGKSYSRLGEREKGLKAFEKLVRSHPDSEWADDALFLSGNIHREATEMKKALLFYRRLAEEYPGSRFADSALWWNAWGYYKADEYQKTEQTLQELINRYPRSFLVAQAGYWQGRIAEKKGNGAKAVEYYGKVLKRAPYTYYGYRAAERLGYATTPGPPTNPAADEIVSACPDGTCPGDAASSLDADDAAPVWTDETRRLLAAEPSFKRTLELMHLEMKKEAAAELWSLEERLPRKRGALIGLSKAFFDLGDYYRSLVLVLRNYERYLDGEVRQVPADLWMLAYPQGYWDSILSYSRKYGQDPYFIAAIIREESQFHAEALSPAGARGVMQVMPATGQWIAETLRLQAFDRAKLFESDTAINLGTWYISHLMKRFRNDPLLVAAAYNAGPEAVSGWIGRNGAGERDEFVESIPFAETRGYVKKVLRNYAEYKRIYAKPGSEVLPVAVTQGTTGPVVGDGAKTAE